MRKIPILFLVILAACKDDPAPLSVSFEVRIVDTSCSGRQHIFLNSSYNALDYRWEFGDGDTSRLKYPTKVYAKAGTYDVKLTVSNMDGRLTLTKTVHVDKDYTLTGPKTDFDRKPEGANRNVTFINKTTGGTSFTWNFGDGSPELITDSPGNVTHTYNTTGGYPVKLTSTNAEGTTCLTKTTEVMF